MTDPATLRTIKPFADEDGYTPFSNYLLDMVMPTLPANAWKVLCFIIRKTRGWQKDTDRLSYSQIETGAGIGSSATVSTAIKALLDKNLIVKVPGSAWKPMGYQLNSALEIEVHSSSEIEVTSETKAHSTSISELHSALEIEDTKERSKEKKERDVATRKARTQRTPKEDTTPAEVRDALAEVCGLDLTLCSREQILNVNTTAKRIYTAGEKDGKTAAEIADTIRYVAKWFVKNDWRGKKGDRPTPKLIVDVWRSAIQERQNGHKLADSRPALPVFKPDPNKPTFAETAKRYREANNDRPS